MKKNAALTEKYNSKSFNFENFYKIEASIRDNKKKIFDQAKAQQNSSILALQSAERIVQAKKNACLSRLASSKTILNTALLQGFNSKNNLETKKTRVNNKFVEANAKIQRLKTLTA